MTDHTETRLDPPFRFPVVWAGLGGLSFVAAMAVAYRPDVSTPAGIIQTIAPWIALAAMVVVLFDTGPVVRYVAIAVAIASWSVLIFEDPRWSVLSFAIYMLAFTADTSRPVVGIGLSGVITAIWTWAFAVSESPAWTAVLPVVAFVAGVVLSGVVFRTARLAEEQAALVDTLRATRQELADSERRLGAFEERERIAAEIHDTLAQGFTSIVLLARSARKSGGADEALASIEATAEENLARAREIVADSLVGEFDGSSLHDSLAHQLSVAESSGLETEFVVVGTPFQLTGDVEVSLLRAVQEAVRNVLTHSEAESVIVTLSYMEGMVALDVRDDGKGFVPGTVSDRGSLTGGQGLETLSRRARALSGELSVESSEGAGSTISILLPVAGR